MIEIIKPKNPYSEVDLESGGGAGPCYGEEYLHSMVKESDLQKAGWLTQIDLDPWKALEQIKIDPSEFKKAVSYSCFLTENKYYWTVPELLLVNPDSLLDFNLEFKNLPGYFIADYSWQRTNQRLENRVPYSITASYMGHGYTDFTMPCDGINEKRFIKLELSNGHFLGCWTWFWYNK